MIPNFMKKKYIPPLLKQNIWRNRSKIAENWFKSLKNKVCKEFLKLENFYNQEKGYKKTYFKKNLEPQQKLS